MKDDNKLAEVGKASKLLSWLLLIRSSRSHYYVFLRILKNEKITRNGKSVWRWCHVQQLCWLSTLNKAELYKLKTQHVHFREHACTPRFLKNLADDQSSFTTEGSIYQIKRNMPIQQFAMGVDWRFIGRLMEVSYIFDFTHTAFLLCKAEGTVGLGIVCMQLFVMQEWANCFPGQTKNK